MAVTQEQLDSVEKNNTNEANKLLQELNLITPSNSNSGVLIVDDSETQRALMKKILRAKDINPKEAENGEEALRIIKADATIHLMFLDISMPIMNGLALLQLIWEDPSLKARLKIVMMTSESSPDMVVQARRFGAKGWIIKPPSQAHIDKYLNLLMPKPAAAAAK